MAEAYFRLIHAVTYFAILVLIVHEKRFAAVSHPMALRVYWGLSYVIVFLFAITAIIRLFFTGNDLVVLRMDDIVVLASLPLYVYLVVVSIRGSSGICEDGVVGNDDELDSNVSGYETASLFSKAVWNWMNPLLSKGYKSALKLDEVPSLPPDFRAEKMEEFFEKKWPKSGENVKYPVLTTLIRCFWKDLVIISLLAILQLVVMYVGPVLIQSFISFTSGDRSNPSEGYYLVLILLISKVLEVLSAHHFSFLSELLGMKIRSSIITTIYKKGLRLTCSSRQAHGVGQIVNYMAVDSQQLSDMMLQLHAVWMMPLQIVASLLLLYYYLGVSMFAALILIVATLISTLWMSSKSNQYQYHLTIKRDSRMKVINELLGNMRVIKFQAWEEHFKEKILSLRNQEFKWLSKFIYLLSWNLSLLWSMSQVISAFTFGAAIFFKNPLDAATVFTATTVFRILQDPIRNFPQSLLSISQAMVSLGRLDGYMTSRELDSNVVERQQGCNGRIAVEVKDGTFSWEDDGDQIVLKDINLEVRKGELAAIVGMVGSGKSSLLASILGELHKISGEVRVCGSTAYVAQTSWIQNSTIQENILFGSPMNNKRYKDVLRVCSLEKDMEILEHGDQTEIGERGINLSGGQKQRIQLARAVYQDRDVYLLDDIFSAVDAQTGSEIFKECVRGALKDKTVVLVTHQVDFLHNADLILVSTDQAYVDFMIPLFLSIVLLMYFTVIGMLFITFQSAWPTIFLIVPLIWLNFWYRRYYIASSRELTRLGSITKAPILHHFSETVSGIMTVRCFGKEDMFFQGNVDRVNANLRMDFHSNASNEWLGLRLEFIGSILICIATVFMVLLPSFVIPPEYVGLALSYGLPLNSVLFWAVYMSCMVENRMVSVERIKQFIRIPSEASWRIANCLPSVDWPYRGDIEINNLQVRYRFNTPLVLKGISLRINGGDKIGIVGRTGSGKSTLIQVFFRIVEPSAGTIIIDGVDICKLGLHDLRSRFGIIPQEPILFQGTVRSNIDPLEMYSDDEIWRSLERCQLKDVVAAKPEKLNSPVVESGDNWSVGQRQLLCLGRVMLKNSKILFMDEATASVDSQTDAVIQGIIREDFANCTIITIAHRIPTVIDCDRVLVVDDGWAKEYERPSTLLERPSLFASLVQEYSNRSTGV
uniref:ABC-type xenobiotic transporter n=1 Tax=Solanum tuberosum TaxID=4113 RepID=M1A713_SOLTU